jgi:glycosyltransferase involved in cell wall biosynthesis
MMKSKRDTLIILTPGFPENEADTTCVPPQQIFVKALKAANPELNVIVLTFTYPFVSHSYQWYGIEVISFGTAGNRKPMRALTGLRARITLQRLQRQYNIIGLLSFWLGKCALTGSRFAKRYQLKHYCWLLGQDAKAGNKFVAKIKPGAKELIALSDFIQREFNRNYGIIPDTVIPVGIDTSLFGPLKTDKDIDLMAAGSLIPLKRFHIFLNVISQLKTEFPSIKAVLCGDGEEMQKLRDLAEASGMKHHISFIGNLPHIDVLALMQRTKVFVHPSAYEGFGAVCAEALYAGAGVVSLVKPMEAAIANWHIVGDEGEMIQVIHDMLTGKIAISTTPVLPYSIQDNARAMLELFGVT